MPERVSKDNEISLNGVRYPLATPILPQLNNSYAQKIVSGETTGDSQIRRSRVEWVDNRGGIGIDRITDVDVANGINLDRSWYSNAYLRHKGHLTCPPLATITAASSVPGVVGAIGELSDIIYAAFGTSVRSYNINTDSWGSELVALAAAATDVITIRLGGTVYLIFAHTSGTTDTTDGSSWNARTDDVLYMASWDDRLWGIDNTGQLRFSLVIGTWINDAQLLLPDGFATDLFVDRDANGEPILYASTKEGLFAHDVANTRFVKTEVDLPFHNDAGFGVSRFRGASFYPAGLAMYRYQTGPDAATLLTMGPDRDDGLPSERRGNIIRTVASHNELIALVDSTSQTLSEFDTFVTACDNDAQVMDIETGVSSLLGWNERGWQVLWEAAADTEAISTAHISNAHGALRAWWGHNRRVNYMALPVDIVNPNETPDFAFANAFVHRYPWLVVGQETNGLSLRLRVQVFNATATETIIPSYATDFVESYTNFSTITTNGITTYDFPNSTTPTGTAFRSIRIRLTGASGSSAKSPDVVGVTLEWRKKLPAQYAWRVEIDMSQAYTSGTSKQMRASLLTAIASNPLVEFTFRDDTGNTRNFYVDVVGQSGLEYTGRDETGNVTLDLAEV